MDLKDLSTNYRFLITRDVQHCCIPELGNDVEVFKMYM